jgi:DNA-binding transcriptional MerR regulator
MAQLDLLSSVTPNTLSPYTLLQEIPLPQVPQPSKASSAYKTIREVSEELNVPQHVLRFWESNFPQVKPSRMRGSRRYYRAQDIEILRTIKTLLYAKGYTIKGAKKVVREGRETLADIPPPRPDASTVSAATQQAADKKTIDKKMLVSELRVLKSMLTSLL